MSIVRNNNQISKFTDEQLIQSSLKKNYEAFEELVRRYEGRIYNLGLRMLHSREDAEDLLQKTFMSVFENMKHFRGDSKVSTWIFRIATNHALMKLRNEKGTIVQSIFTPVIPREKQINLLMGNLEADVSESYEKKELLEQLEKAVKDMPEIYRLVFILKDVEEFSNKEIAEMLDLSVPAVKSRVLRARLYLREKLLKKGVKGANL